MTLGLKQVLRSSDLVSEHENCRIGVLILEASGGGLDRVVERIRGFADDFLRGQIDSSYDPIVRVYKASFPEEFTAFSQLVKQLARGRELVN
jgi:hypothetical protein